MKAEKKMKRQNFLTKNSIQNDRNSTKVMKVSSKILCVYVRSSKMTKAALIHSKNNKNVNKKREKRWLSCYLGLIDT
jgi:hypothetical protein